jgi:hypothetical protein
MLRSYALRFKGEELVSGSLVLHEQQDVENPAWCVLQPSVVAL